MQPPHQEAKKSRATELYDELPAEDRAQIDEQAKTHLDDVTETLVREHYTIKARLDAGTSDDAARDKARLAEIDRILDQ